MSKEQEQYKKFKYNPLSKPTPMLSFFQKPDKKVFDDNYPYKYGEYINSNNVEHAWNIGAYIIFSEKNTLNGNEEKLLAYRFFSFEYLIWLLRIQRCRFVISLPNEFVEKNKKILDEMKDELIPLD